MKLILSAVGILMVLTLSSTGSAQTVQKKSLTLEGAKSVIAAAVAEAKIRTRRVAPLPSSTKAAI